VRRFLRGIFAFWSLGIASLCAAGDYYAGGIAAMATLSADGRSIVSSTASQVSLYKPENGPAVNLFFGRYLGNYVSVQGNFIWNANDLTFVSSSVLPQRTSFYQQTRDSSQTSVIGDALVFFRDRHSLVRPYLSAGIGVVHVESSQHKLDFISGSPTLPPRDFRANRAGLRAAVGIDVRLRRGFSFRYSFSETLSSNPISDQLSPPGQRTLKNFQNLWGFVKNF
jgi:outer membrane protein with beta-barrel domain